MNTIFAWAPGGMEIVLILGAILILFGSKKIPEFAKGLGQGIREFKKATREVTDEIQNAGDSAPVQSKPPGAARPADPRVISQSPGTEPKV
jgi:sec-independent protein translocase protein TatA